MRRQPAAHATRRRAECAVRDHRQNGKNAAEQQHLHQRTRCFATGLHKLRHEGEHEKRYLWVQQIAQHATPENHLERRFGRIEQRARGHAAPLLHAEINQVRTADQLHHPERRFARGQQRANAQRCEQRMRHDAQAHAKRMRKARAPPLREPTRQRQQHIRPRNGNDDRHSGEVEEGLV